jgi:lipooligosaccharide transport system permease protein
MITLSELPLRIIPVQMLRARRPQRMLERQVVVNKRNWTILFSGFFEPLFYLLSIRIGFGALVGDVQVGDEVLSYEEFVAPALMVASAMNGAVYESTMNVYHKLRYARLYDSILATPMTFADVALGEIAYSTFRGSLYSAAFLVTLVSLGMAGSWWIVMALPVCILVAFAFSAVGMAVTTYMRSWADLEYVPSVMLPMFLFSATFYPVSSYGDWGWVVQLSPLYHGVALARGFNLGELSWTYLVHVGVLVALALVGLSVSACRIEKLLLK